MSFYRYLAVILTLILTITVSAFSMTSVAATSEPVLQCLGEITNVYYEPWDTAQDEWLQSPWRSHAPVWVGNVMQLMATLEREPVLETEAQHFYGLTGTDIWLGYPPAGAALIHGQHGFDMPEDAYGWFKLVGMSDDGQEVEVWFIASDTTPGTVYVLPFSTTALFARSDGSNYGIHPCGAFSTLAEPVADILNGILG